MNSCCSDINYLTVHAGDHAGDHVGDHTGSHTATVHDTFLASSNIYDAPY